MHRLPGLLLHCSAILGFSAAVSANPWVQKTGHGIAIVNAVAYRTSHNFDTQGEQQSQPRFSKYELNPYLEYGLSDDWTIGTSLFLHKLQQATAEADQQNWGLGNSELFVRYQLWRKSRSAVTLEPFGALPAFYANAGSPRAGRDEGDLGLAVNAGYGFALAGAEHFATWRTAYRHRLGALADQWQMELRTGFNLSEHWLVMPELQWTLPAQGVASDGFSVAGQNDYRLLKAQLSAVYQFTPNDGIQIGAFRHISGEQTGAGGGWLVSLWRRF